MKKYETVFFKTSHLTKVEQEQLAKLYLRHYSGTDRTRFLSDLDTKDEVLILLCGKDIVGFTTLESYPFPWPGGTLRIIYSGDTIVDRAHWGQQTLAFAWIKHMGEIKKIIHNERMYWFLIVKGHRTFKFLSAFSKLFYPHWAYELDELRNLVNALAYAKFGDYYHPDKGIIEFETSMGHLRPEIALPTEEEKKKDSVRFFLKKNPGYIHGHELACLCEISEENMKPLTRRIFFKGLS
jgi:hypothetical protein